MIPVYSIRNTIIAVAAGALLVTGCVLESEFVTENDYATDIDQEASVDGEFTKAPASPDYAPKAFTPWFSEEAPGQAVCAGSRRVTAYACRGSFCDEQSFDCRTPLAGVSINTAAGGFVNPMISEESGPQFCPAGRVMTGLRCNGSFCDNISMHCSPGTNLLVDNNECHWFGPISEEHAPLTLPNNHSIIGVRCSGSYCDNKEFFACPDVPTNSCANRCGGAAPDGCFCDAVCQTFGDCCPDKLSVCGS